MEPPCLFPAPSGLQGRVLSVPPLLHSLPIIAQLGFPQPTPPGRRPPHTRLSEATPRIRDPPVPALSRGGFSGDDAIFISMSHTV